MPIKLSWVSQSGFASLQEVAAYSNYEEHPCAFAILCATRGLLVQVGLQPVLRLSRGLLHHDLATRKRQ